jgi:hypothetical protein
MLRVLLIKLEELLDDSFHEVFSTAVDLIDILIEISPWITVVEKKIHTKPFKKRVLFSECIKYDTKTCKIK